MRPRPRWLGLVVAVLLLVPHAAAADPSMSPASDGASPPPADCVDLAALLPTELGAGLPLAATPTVGVEGIDPDDLLDPFLAQRGLDRADVCGVSLRAGAPLDGLTGLLLRVRGAGAGFAGMLAASLAERLRGYGHEVAEETSEAAGVAIPLLRIDASGTETLLLLIDVLDDTVLLGTSTELPDALLPLMPGPSMAPVRSPTASAQPSATASS